MNIRITVKNNRTGASWDEDYSKPYIDSLDQAEQWAEDLLNWFNDGQPLDSSTRSLVSVRELEEGEGKPRVTRR